MTDPDGAGIPAGQAGEGHAAVIAVRAGLACDGLALDFRGGARSRGDSLLQHIDRQPGGAFLESDALFLRRAPVDDYVAVAVLDAAEGDWLLVDAAVSERAEGDGHLHGRKPGRAERQTERRGVDVCVVHAHAAQEFRRVFHAYVIHQRLRGGNVVALFDRLAQRRGAGVARASVVGGVILAAVAVGVAVNGYGHVVGDGGGAASELDGRGVYGDGLDRRADRHGHVGGAVERFARGRRGASAHDGLQFARAVIEHHGRGLRLDQLRIRAVGVALAVDGIARVAHEGVVLPCGQRIFNNFLDFGVQAQINVIAAGAQLVFHLRAVGGRILKRVQLQQRVDHVLHGVFDVVRVFVHAGGAVGCRFQHGGGVPVQRKLIFVVGDELVFVHLPQRVVGAVVGDVRRLAGVIVAAGIIVVGAAGHAGEHGAFAQGKLVQLLAEIAHRGGFYAVIAFAQINRVEVAFQDFVLGVDLFQLHGQIGLLDFALVALLVGKHAVFNQLLRDRRAALHARGHQVRYERAEDSLHVDAVMRIEPCVLHGDERVLQIQRNFLDGHHDAILRPFIVGNHVALRVVEKRGFRLIVDHGQIELGRGFGVCLDDTEHRAAARHADDQHEQRKNPHRAHQRAYGEIRPAVSGLEDGPSAHRRVNLIFSAHARLL